MAKKTVARKKKESAKTLIIVESPAKAKTIEKYLGKDYIVRASMGHLIDLPKSRLAINIENDFMPEYITVRGRASILKDLEKEAKKAKQVLLASDHDREGEAIAYHLATAISNYCQTPIARIVFNEITPQAIKHAVEHPLAIDEAKVNAQKARRVLDRLVGYNLSPLLWKKVKNGLSAGRVQSVALRLICECEKKVEAFIPEEYWTLEGQFKKGRHSVDARLVRYDDKKSDFASEDAVQQVIDSLHGKEASITDIKTLNKTITPKPPFTTSTLQQTAANRLGFTSRKTMQIAQQLYEGVSLGSSRVGLITYMRTDSVRISQTAAEEAHAWLTEHFPEQTPQSIPSQYAISASAQDAHEGIRPTYVTNTPESLKTILNKDQLRLYTLIWERFLASQMKKAKTQTTTFEISIEKAVFRFSSTAIVEKGFYAVIKLLISKDEKGKSLPPLQLHDNLSVSSLTPEQHFTQGPSRYTDASMVKVLEEKGIGRPSTYAPIISVLLDRYYVTRSNKQLMPTPLGKIINELLTQNFNTVIDANFTATMESQLDAVEEASAHWPSLIKAFYTPFIAKVNAVMEELDSVKGSLDEKTDFVCESCGSPMVKKLGRFGFFLACERFPECRQTKSIPLAKCPRSGCGGDIVQRKSKGKNKEFYGCTNYPECTFISHFKPSNSPCPECGWFLVEKFDKKMAHTRPVLILIVSICIALLQV